ncbi:iron(III) transport system substrate-binding protein [Hasllibacter halocynthiae]|uniref:Iron(III) transport system substrate-binding protein n=1 Tax=Hasllibacter halocynthiae TaxID=595589 RepID=A0A2T0X6P4_9RHOB|nr:extracellular solute-binding protein [Hasllibacter halocynthiae]PRY94618.1 iron(III) transport system substrate-binding protein [Hasllibacter halocynthiae]
MTRTSILALLAAATAAPVLAQELNLYSSRHYDTDERLYSDFEDATGITINRIEGNADELIARMEAEGANSPADVLLTVDTTRLERAKDLGLLQPVESELLEERIPANLRDEDDEWFGFSQRARIVFYDEDEVGNPPQTYMDLADPQYEGMICHRSSTNVYSQTLLSAIIEHYGEEAAAEWAQGFVDNFARDPQGGDTDQLRGLVSGECDIAISNTYYFARAIRKDVDGLGQEELDGIGWVFPMMTDEEGAHVNLSGAGVAANAPHYDNAVAFLEYLASDQAQEYFANGNDEYPAVEGVPVSESVATLGEFEGDTVDLSAVAQNVDAANRIFGEVGWE